MPAALTYNLADTKYNWGYWTAPQKHLDGRRLPWPRGRVLGGSSSLNAMVYMLVSILAHTPYVSLLSSFFCVLIKCRSRANPLPLPFLLHTFMLPVFPFLFCFIFCFSS